MRGLAVLLFVSFAINAASAAPLVGEFPGNVKDLYSPNGKARVFYVERRAARAEIQSYSLHVDLPNKKSYQVMRFYREATLQWSVDSSAFYISNVWGSNVADCYVAQVSAHSVKLVNLTKLIYRSYPAPAKFLKHADHGYVVCDEWKDAGHLRFTVYGDIYPAEYRYTFVYNLRSGTVKQLSARITKSSP